MRYKGPATREGFAGRSREGGQSSIYIIKGSPVEAGDDGGMSGLVTHEGLPVGAGDDQRGQVSGPGLAMTRKGRVPDYCLALHEGLGICQMGCARRSELEVAGKMPE